MRYREVKENVYIASIGSLSRLASGSGSAIVEEDMWRMSPYVAYFAEVRIQK